MKIAVLSPIAWRTPPENYGPWEQVASNITEGLVEQGVDVTLFATANSLTNAKLEAVCDQPYATNPEIDPKVWESLHISHLMEQAHQFDLIHNNYDFLPLTYSKLIDTPMLTTIHGFSSPAILPVYKKYNTSTYYVSISDSDRSPELDYIKTIYNGIAVDDFTFNDQPENYLLFFGRIHPDKGTYEAIQIAQKTNNQLIIAGLIQDEPYYNEKVKPYLSESIRYVGNVGPEQRDSLLGKASALLHPVHFEEPFGLSVAEAMFCGTPVIAFKKGSMKELILDQKTGFLVHSLEQAIEAVQDIHTIDRGECRRHAVENFSRKKMIDAYIEVYEEILRAGR
ncbi:MAG: glycosyltransferase family 4 protein [Bacteroidales bacterium]|nr:glycosyltransferase family 4 protein [Bacteroidales bacterium]